MNSEYFVALAKTFEERYGVKFVGIEDGPITDEKKRILQYKQNIDVLMSVLEKNELGKWISDRLVQIGDTVVEDKNIRLDTTRDPFLDEFLMDFGSHLGSLWDHFSAIFGKKGSPFCKQFYRSLLEGLRGLFWSPKSDGKVCFLGGPGYAPNIANNVRI